MWVIDTLKSFVDSWNIWEKIDEFNELTKWLTEPELTEIRNKFAEKISTEFKSRLSIFKWNVDDSLKDKKENLEIKDVEFSMEWLKQNIDTKFFKDLLNAKIWWNEVFWLWLKQKMVESNIGADIEKNISVIIWNKIIKDVWLSSWLSSWFKTVFDKLNEYYKKIKDLNVKDNVEDLKKDFSFWKLSSFMDSFSGLSSDWDKSKEKWKITINDWWKAQEIEVPNEIVKLVEILNETVKWYFANLSWLLKLADEKKLKDDPKFKNLMKNPLILDELLDKWVYQKDWFNIDIKTWILELWEVDENTLKSVQNEFMAIAVKNTNNIWKTVDKLKENYTWFTKILQKFWVSKDSLEKMKQALYSIPIIWFLFKILFWDFLDWISANIDSHEIDDSIKNSMIKFQELMKDNDFNSKFPFKNEKQFVDKDNRKDTENITKFLGNIKNQEKALNQWKDVEKSIISDENFWENIFSKEDVKWENELYKVIRKKIKTIKTEKNDIPQPQEEFFIKLSKIEFSEIPSTWGVNPTEVNPEQDIKNLPLEDQLKKITWLPAKINIEWNEITVDISPDWKNIIFWGDKYSISLIDNIMKKERFEKISFNNWKVSISYKDWITWLSIAEKEIKTKQLVSVFEELYKMKKSISETEEKNAILTIERIV